jgi:ABC-type polysaccharide/polyol phosphate export permease
MYKTLIGYRRYILVNSAAEVWTRYAGTSLGVLWNLIHPLTIVLVVGGVLSGLSPARGANAGMSMGLYVACGLIPWLALADGISRGTTSLVQNAIFLKKLPIPEEVYIAKSVVSTSLHFTILLALLIVIALVAKGSASPIWLLVVPTMLLMMLLTFGIALVLSPLNVVVRDVSQAVPAILQLGIWMSPILYPEELAPNVLRRLQVINPFAPFLTAFREIIIADTIPPTETWLAMGGWTLAAVVLGVVVLRRLRSEIRDLV